MDTNTTSNNAWIYVDRCKVYKDHLKSNCIADEFKQQLKQDILIEFSMFLDALKDDLVNVNTNKNVKQSYNFKISCI